MSLSYYTVLLYKSMQNLTDYYSDILYEAPSPQKMQFFPNNTFFSKLCPPLVNIAYMSYHTVLLYKSMQNLTDYI